MEARKIRKLSLQDTEAMDREDRSPSPNYDNYPKVKCDDDQCQVISMKHYNMILSELRCPGCSDAMVAPIRLCLRGHSICNSCVGLTSLNKCPLCQESISEMRCVTLEAIAAKVHFLCPNSIYGCSTRLPHDLMKWHNERCVYQKITCFLGQVWGECEWTGCKINWMDHCWEKHADRMYKTSPVAIQWEYKDCQRIRPLVGYYILHVFDEIFNVYQIYDKRDSKMVWTVTWAKSSSRTEKKFAFEIELYSPEDPTLLLIERHAVHCEKDVDILADGKSAKVNLGEIMRYLSTEKILNYNVKILEISPFASQLSVEPATLVETVKDPDDLTSLGQLCNLKNIPNHFIITRNSKSKCDECQDKNGDTENSPVDLTHPFEVKLRDKTARNSLPPMPYLDSSRSNTIPKPPRRSLAKTNSLNGDITMDLLRRGSESCVGKSRNETSVEENVDRIETQSLRTKGEVVVLKRRMMHEKPVKVLTKMYELTKHKIQRKFK